MKNKIKRNLLFKSFFSFFIILLFFLAVFFNKLGFKKNFLSEWLDKKFLNANAQCGTDCSDCSCGDDSGGDGN